ncbi:MAG: hypothetical protein QOF37_2652, partial [Thermoleophilaceae bacterium]|nr:hypothetical protein [Thermoleophilaceae bacterium]
AVDEDLERVVASASDEGDQPLVGGKAK